MKIAVLGAGYCGLAVAWHLSSHAQVTVFDAEPLGKTSFASTGLLHPFLGTRPRLSWNGFTAFDETLDFLSAMQKKSDLSIFKQTGIFKPILYDRQVPDFKKAVDKFDQIEWISSFQNTWNYDAIRDLSGIWIPEGVCVFSQHYLSVLSKDCKSRGVERVHQHIASLDELQDFDQIILATGGSSHLHPELSEVSFDRVKGQALLCEWPKDIQPLPMSIIGQGHVCMSQDQKSCFIGSTYEHEFDTEEPTDLVMKLKDQISVYFSRAKDIKVQAIQAGIRMHRKDSHLPLVMRMDKKIWAFTAVGSRGLLYHHFLGKRLTQAVLQNDETILPLDVQIKSLMV